MAALIVMEQFAYFPQIVVSAGRSASDSGAVEFPDIHNVDEVSAILSHSEQLIDNGDGSFTFTTELMSSYSYFDESRRQIESQDGSYTLDKAGTYLIELWGGDGGNGSSVFPLTFKAGAGGKGGFVYGLLEVTEEQAAKKNKLYYEIGSRGQSETRSVTGGGTGGIGGGAGDIAVFTVGAGGGYSAVYLVGENEELTDGVRNDPSKLLMIAGGGGGGGAGAALHTLPGLFGGEGKANGGDGGTFDSDIIEVPNIENFVSTNTYVGKYYAGENGSTSGTKGAYVGKGGTDIPGEIVTSFIGYLEASSYPNDWQQTYHPELDRGVGGASNFRGGGGGAGFAGGSGGMQNEPLDARNVGGGGGGSSYVGKFDNFTPNAIGDADYFVERDGNTNAETGGAVVIRHLSNNGTDYSYLNSIDVSGEISQYFDIVSTNCSNSGNSFTANGSVAPVSSGLAKGQEKDKLTVSVTIKPKAGFFGGNRVPIFKENGSTFTVTGGDKTTKFTVGDDVKYVNVPYNISIKTKNSTVHQNDVITKADLYADGYSEIAYDASDPMQDFISGISYEIEGENADDYIYLISQADVEAKIKAFVISAEITPKSGLEPAVVGNAGSSVVNKIAYVQCIDSSVIEIDGFLAKLEKSLSYNETDKTYDLKVNAKIDTDNERNKSFSINEAVSSEQVLDLVLNGSVNKNDTYISIAQNGANNKYSGTLKPGIYYVEAWGGDGGNGYNAPSSLQSASSNNKYGGYGGKGGYINGYVKLDQAQSLDITLGYRGTTGTSEGVGGKGGKATYVNIGESADEMYLIAGGGGGGTHYLKWGNFDQNGHMGYSGNDGYREYKDSEGNQANYPGAVYRGIPNDGNNYTKPSTDPYYKTDGSNKNDGEDGRNSSVGNLFTNYSNIFVNGTNTSFDNDNVENLFAKGGYSEKGDNVKDLSELSPKFASSLFIQGGTNNTTVNLGAYEYVYYFSNSNGYYVSQWTNKSSDTSYYNSDDDFFRESYYQGTTKAADEIKTVGAVRITRLGVYGGSNYNDITTPHETAEDVVARIKSDYDNESCYTDFTISGEFTEYFDLQSDSNYSFHLSSDNVVQVAPIPDDTDTSSLPGYTLVTHNYKYGLSGTGSVTFKLKPKAGFLGGNDVPLLKAATLTHQYTTSETDDDTVAIPPLDYTDFANVKLASETLEDTISSDPIFVDYGSTITADVFSDNAAVYNALDSEDWQKDHADYGDLSYEPELGDKIKADTDYILTASLKADSAASKGTVIDEVDTAERNFKVPVYVSYPIETKLTNLTSNAADKFPTTVDDTELVFDIYADDGYDLPAAEDVAITNTDITDPNASPTVIENAVVEKIGDKITVYIPRKSINGKVTVTASGVDAKHSVKYYYEMYDPISKMISLEEAVDSKTFANGDVISGITYPSRPDEYPNGYDGYFWDWSIEADNNGDHIMGQEDVIIIGTYKPITYAITVNYYTKESKDDPNPQLRGTYISPLDRTLYDNGTYKIALTKGAEFYIASPDFEGYVTDTPYIAGVVDDAFIADLNETVDGHPSMTVAVYYTKVPDDTELIVNFVKCDVRGAPLGIATTIPAIIGDSNYDYSEIDGKIATAISGYDKVKIAKFASDGTQTEVEEITGAGTYNVYYREIPQTVTIKLYKNIGDTDPIATRTAVIGREYSYDPDKDDYIPLPTAVDPTHEYRHTGWKTDSGDIIEDDMIVSTEGETIDLYAVWESSKITITVKYLYAWNVQQTSIRGTEAHAQYVHQTDYGKSYEIISPTLQNYTAEPLRVTGVALADKPETVYYTENAADITIKANIYSLYYKDSDSGKAIAGAPLLKGGTFELYAQDGTLIGTKQNTSGVVSWDNKEFDIRKGMTYTIKCTSPPDGYGTGEATVTVGTSDDAIVIDDIEIFLDVTPFEMPYAGSTPMTGYTVFGSSIMVLAVFLLFVHMRSKTEEEKIKKLNNRRV